MGRFSVQLDVANNIDLANLVTGSIRPDQVRRTRISGIVDTGAMRLVLPESVAKALGLRETGTTGVRFADGRRDQKKVVGNVHVEILGRSGVFSAVVEPNRPDALIGAIVLEELDLLPDMARQTLVPRDPHQVITEIEEAMLAPAAPPVGLLAG